MQFFGFNLSEHLHSRWCRFIIHRYLGHLLEKNLSLDQLSIDLSKGCVEVNQVMLNAQYINEMLETLKLPLRLVDGYIGTIQIRVPWANLMADASEVDLNDVQLTFRGMDGFKLDNQDVSSMLGSVVDSLVTSIDIAQSFQQEEKDEGEWTEGDEEGSVHALSKVVDAVVSRFCCNIEDLILRIESDSPQTRGTSTAVEFKLNKLRFMDEQMQQCRQEGASAETITSEPHGLSNLNKCIKIEGVSLYTDIFSKADLPVADDEGHLMTSMSLRREHKKSLQEAGSSLASMYMSTNLAESMMQSQFYQSCYSTTSIHHPSDDDFKSVRPEPTLISNPVKFAEIAGETTVLIRIKNADVNAKNFKDSKFEFDVYSKGVNILVTPSQVELIKSLTGLLIPVDERVVKKRRGGSPMEHKDFDMIHRQLDDITANCQPGAGNALKRGNWQGAEDVFQSISLKDDTPHRISSIRRSQETTGSDAKKTETASINMKIGRVLAFLTHDDPLCAENVQRAERGPRDAVDVLHTNANRFFEKAASLKAHSSVETTDDLYPKDHIRLIGSTVAVTHSIESNAGSGTRVSTKLSIANCDINEFLTAASTMDSTPRHNPLLSFDREDGDGGSQFTVVLKSEEGRSSTVVSLGKCCSEVDMSISDRISHLLCPNPFFKQPTRGFTQHSRAPSGLSEDLFSEVTVREATPTTIEVNCANWTIDLKIPKADLRSSTDDRISHTVQNVHEEFLRLKLTSAKFLVPSAKPNGPTTVEIMAAKITGHFIGDLEKLGCAEEDTAFLYAGSRGKPVRIALEFDGSNKSLKASNSGVIGIVEDMTKSISADIMRNKPKKEGPFAQTHQSFTKSNGTAQDAENIVRAGSREEMDAFARDCLEQSDVTLKIDFPVARLLIPNHQFLELLYNRLVNDFALWQPSAPAFKAKNTTFNVNLDDQLFKEVKSAMGAPRYQMESDDEDETYDYSRMARDQTRAQSHLFSLQLDVVAGCMVLGTEIVPASPDASPLPAQVATELGGTQLFVCSGFHGDLNQTFFHLTTTNVTVAQRNDPTIPKNVLSREFGSHKKSEVHLRSLPVASHLREGRSDDSLAIALHLVTSEDGRVKETTAAIALRLLELNLIPVKRMEECWIMQLKDLFYLEDFEIPGYEMPVCNTYLHVHLDHAVLAHDHCRIVEGSPLKYKFLLGNVDISSTLVPSMTVNKFLCLFERVHLHMTNEEEEQRTVTYEDEEPRVAKSGANMVHIMEIGLFQLELLIYNQLAASEGEKRNCPLFELKCQNDQIKAWLCHDSLTTLINTAVEVAQSDLWKDENASEIAADDADDDAGSVASSGTDKTETKAEKKENRLQRLVDAALEEPHVAYEEQSNEVAYAKEAIDEWRPTGEVNYDSNLLDDAMRDLSIGSHPRTTSFSTDEEFFMVEDIPGCGITSINGEPRIRLIDPDHKTENGNYYYNYIPDHIKAPSAGADLISLPPDYAIPLIRYNVKDISILLHIYGGNDLGSSPDSGKSYSAEEYRTGSGRGQSVLQEARGGPNRDHSVSVVLELAKISYVYQEFDKDAPTRAMNFMSIQDVTVHDRLTLSNIKEMLYQYATAEHPRRTCAPMLAIRMVENHQQEGKLRVSMLPIRLNVDQDTLEFLEDFAQAVNTGLALPESSKIQLANHPIVEVPAGVKASPSNPRIASAPPLPSPRSIEQIPSPPSPVDNVENVFNTRMSDLSDMDDLFGLSSTDAPLVPTGDWASSSIHSVGSNRVDDILSRSTMEGSLYGGGLGGLRIDDEEEDDEIPIMDEPFLTSDDRFTLATTATIHSDETREEGGGENDEDDRDTICSESPRRASPSDGDGKIRGQTFFKEFAFSPGCSIHIDYHGKNKYNVERSGAVLGVLRGIGQLNRTEIHLKAFEHHNGLLGLSRCASHAISEWQETIMANLPGVLGSVGPISPLVQIGKGIADFFWLPVAEMRKEDGHVVKGIQRGTASFGFSTAAAVVDLAQRLVGVVQITAESVLHEMTPDHPSLNNRNRRPVNRVQQAPQNVRHGMQLAYDLIANGVQETREDIELATQEDRASGRSSMRSVLRYATPAILRPFVVTSQIGYQLLGGLKNQLRPDQFHDEQHKWRNEQNRAGIDGN